MNQSRSLKDFRRMAFYFAIYLIVVEFYSYSYENRIITKSYCEGANMNQRQAQKIIPSTWIMIEKQNNSTSDYILYAIDWKRKARWSWEGWNDLADLLQFNIPVRRKLGSPNYSSQPCAKIAKKAIVLRMNEQQYDRFETLLYKPFSKKKWNSFLKEYRQ